MSFHRSLVLLLLGWVTASAQQPAEAPPATVTPAPAVPAPAVPAPAVPAPPPGVPVPGVAQPAPAGAPAAKPADAPKPGIPLGENKIVEDIIEPKLTGNALAGLYRKYTGRRVIVTAGAATAEMSFVQEASPQDPLTYAQAAELLRKAAVLENFVFVQHPQDPSLDVLTLATGGPRPNNVDVNVHNENSELPDNDVVITYVMTLQHIKPDQALNVFTQIIGQFGSYGSISAVPNASAVVITEKASLIKSLIELQKSIDVPGSVQSSKFIPVQYADVTEIATTLTELLTAQQTTQRTAGIQRTDGGGAPAPGAAPGQAGGSGGAGEESPVQILPEPRTNRIFAMGRPVDLMFVEGLVREFDIPTSDKTFLRRKLRFLTVSEFLPIAGDALTRAFTGTGEGGSAGGGTSGGSSSSRTQSNNRSTTSSSGSSSRSSRSSSSFGGSSSGFGGSSSGFGGSSSGFGGGGAGGGNALSDPSISSAPESLLVGRTLLVADNITNSVVAQGPPSALEIIEKLLDQIDVKPDQVMISTVIGQLTLNDSKEYGVGYLFNGEHVEGGLTGGGLPILPIADDANNRFPRLDPSQLAGGGLRAIGRVDDLSIYLKALQSKGDFTVLSRPSIFTSNNQKGTISSGERIAIPTNSNSFSNGGASTNIEYQDVVLKLEVIPLVNSDNEITMEIALLNDEQNGTQIIQGAGSNGEDLEVPRISTREIITTATVPNNNTIVLGGLIVGKNNENVTGIPILSDIPYLGKLFSVTTDNNDRTELMVFIQPTIVTSNRSLSDVQADMDARYKVAPRSRDFADGTGVLPGLNDVPQVEEKGKGGSTYRASTSQPATGPSTMKPSLRPPHRR
jgi:type II secretion system protein D